MTIEDLRNPKRKSGFNFVGPAGKSSKRAGKGQKIKWFARAGWYQNSNGNGTTSWNGPRRLTPESAAQDYCEYVNENNVDVFTDTLNFPGHEGSRESLPRNQEVEDALGVLRDHRAQQEGKPGYVYLIGIENDPYAVKVGYSTNCKARVKEHQTGNPRKLILLASFQGTKEDEKRIQLVHIEDNLTGEWFRPSASLFEEFGLIVEDCNEGVIFA